MRSHVQGTNNGNWIVGTQGVNGNIFLLIDMCQYWSVTSDSDRYFYYVIIDAMVVSNVMGHAM